MEEQLKMLFYWVIDIPKVIVQFVDWLSRPLCEPFISVSPLFLLGSSGVLIITGIIATHIVRLYTP